MNLWSQQTHEIACIQHAHSLPWTWHSNEKGHATQRTGTTRSIFNSSAMDHTISNKNNRRNSDADVHDASGRSASAGLYFQLQTALWCCKFIIFNNRIQENTVAHKFLKTKHHNKKKKAPKNVSKQQARRLDKSMYYLHHFHSSSMTAEPVFLQFFARNLMPCLSVLAHQKHSDSTKDTLTALNLVAQRFFLSWLFTVNTVSLIHVSRLFMSQFIKFVQVYLRKLLPCPLCDTRENKCVGSESFVYVFNTVSVCLVPLKRL